MLFLCARNVHHRRSVNAIRQPPLKRKKGWSRPSDYRARSIWIKIITTKPFDLSPNSFVAHLRNVAPDLLFNVPLRERERLRDSIIFVRYVEITLVAVREVH